MSIRRRALVATFAFALLAAGMVPAPDISRANDVDDGIAASELATDTLATVQPLAPEAFGEEDQTGLAQPDPTEGLSLIDAPEANNMGSMALTYPIEIPPGHGITPELALQYDSSGGNGWLGLGWDLEVGAIAVDTSFGAPHFDSARESESYLLDGDLLTPNANGAAWEARVPGSRSDYARQVERDYDEIIRHRQGTGWPANYFWEVRSKDGNVRWYGGRPDSGGPSPTAPASFDEASVVRNEAGHIVEWKLSAHRDVGVNLIRYEYERVTYAFDGDAWVQNACVPANTLCGQHTFLKQIYYTDATDSVTDRNGPPYRVEFIRESELPTPPANIRRDPIVDGGLGYLDVLADRLARVEVRFGAAPATGHVRVHDDANDLNIAARYSFGYSEGRFGKTLLSTITQGVADLHTHTLEWVDDLENETAGDDTRIRGLGASVTQDTKADVRDRQFLSSTADVSALGGGESNGGSGNIYIGFNPNAPMKTGSFGAGIELSGADSNSLVEWVDLNGDNLPDKVFVANNGDIRFRLNTSGPTGNGLWDGSSDVDTLPSLSKDSNFGFQVSFEAYPLVAIGVGTGLSWSRSSSYFTDVNGDGLVDFVNGGRVLFNRIVGGIPTFQSDSGGTPVPLGDSTLPMADSEKLRGLVADMQKHSPPVDTVRRFVAPYTGQVRITAPVSFRAGTASVDSARVAIQHNAVELVSAQLPASSTVPRLTAPISPVSVTAGDRLYFRVGSIDDGVDDIVDWQPVVEYLSPGWPELDINGHSQHRFAAAEDFTLAGRPGDFVIVPAAGTVRINANISTSEPLTDDVTLVAEQRQVDGTTVRTELGTVTAGSEAEDRAFTGELTVAYHPDPADANLRQPEAVSVFIQTDSPIDLSDLDWGATLTLAPGAVDAQGEPVAILDEEGNEIFEPRVRPHVEIYPYTASTSGVRPAELDRGANTYEFAVAGFGERPAGVTTVDAVVTVKSRAGLLAKAEVQLPWPTVGPAVSPDFSLDVPEHADPQDEAEDLWLEVMFRDPQFSRDGLTLTEFVRVSDDNGTRVETSVANAILRWSGQQGMFPLPYRGWAVAGYSSHGDLPGGGAKGESAMAEAAFEVRAEGSTPENPQRSDLSLQDTETAQDSYPFIAALSNSGRGRWEGPRGESLWADATGAQTSRLAADSLRFDVPSGGDGRSAPTRVGLAGPGLNLSFGIAIAGASAALSPSWGLVDFEDLNGDGYPDQLAEGDITYTDQLGGYLGSRRVDRLGVSNQDLTVSVNGGLSSGMVDIVPSSKGNTNAVGGDSANKGQGASDSGPAYNLGLSASGGYSWSSPNASASSTTPGSTYGDQIGTLRGDYTPEDGPAIQRALVDINGDGLPDHVYTTDAGVFAFYNLGYGFTRHAVSLGGGGFESKESATAGAGLGFSLPYGEFGGGVNLLWNWDWSTYSWQDLNGDGIPDRLRKAGSEGIRVAFGTGSGLLDEVSYGDFPSVENSQQMAFDRGNGVGGGVSATGYIGPLCVVWPCFLVIGGGGGYNHSVSATNVTVDDVNGDGYADVLQSMNDNELQVRLNQHGFTNLLESVSNPLGGSFSVEYERVGNTYEHPDSLTVLSRVDILDGRSADQVVTVPADPDGDTRSVTTTGHYANTFTYDGLLYDRAHRSSLGFETVTATEIDTTTDPDSELRTTVQRYHNANVFVSGLLRDVNIFDVSGGATEAVRGSATTWGARLVRGDGGPVSGDPAAPATFVALAALPGDLHSVESRGWSVAVAPVGSDDYWFDGEDHTFSNRSEFVYDGRGNVLSENDMGAPDDPFDDLVTELTYTDCRDGDQTAFACRAQTEPSQPFWSSSSCSTGVSLPVTVSVTGIDAATGDPVLLRERRAPLGLCDNAAPLEIDELVAPGVYATTNMKFNAYGDYELVMAPPDANGIRYTVRYTYDADRHSDIAEVEEFDVPAGDADTVLASGPDPATAGVTSAATFDPLSGRVASRTDANGAVREFAYDEHGRIVTASSAGEAVGAPLLVTYEYHANATDYGYAVARHVDALDGNPTPAASDAAGLDATDTIDTVVFVDGLGRVRQTKRDARMLVGGTEVIGRQVSDVVEFDPLARPVLSYAPTVDAGPAGRFSATGSSAEVTATTWTSYDAILELNEPGAPRRVTAYDYPWETYEGEGPLLAWTVSTDPDGRVLRVGQDVRDVVRHQVDSAAPRPDLPALDDLATTYRVNSLGELLAVVDSAGNESTYTYDLAGRVTGVTTPDGGAVTTTYDLAGHRRTVTNPAMRELGEQTSYDYALNRLVEVDHPGTVDDVSYTYGSDNDDGRFTAGRVAAQSDRTRLVTNTYDAAGNLAVQASTMKRHNWEPDLAQDELAKFTYTTTWQYDPLGRLVTVEYPDAKTLQYVPEGTSVADLADPAQLGALLQTEDAPGELVTYGYDSGGLLRGLTGAEAGLEHQLEPIAPDAEGNPRSIMVPRLTEHAYTYLGDRNYDEWLYSVREELGNGAVTTSEFAPDTRWLTSRITTSPAGDLQRLSYTYDAVGRPETYLNELPFANRAINGGRTEQTYVHDGFGRIVGASGTFSLKAGEEQRYSYGVGYTPETPWSIVSKEQSDGLFPARGRSKPTERTSYDFTRILGTLTGPLQVVSEDVTALDGKTKVYDSTYTANGEVSSVLVAGGDTAKTRNNWDRGYTWTLGGLMTSAERGDEIKTFAYDDIGVMRIKDGGLLTRDGAVVDEHGGGPETLFPNPWFTVVAQKIYKHITDGKQSLATKMDGFAAYEDKQLYAHSDVVGSTNMVSDVQGRGFQRHEYFPSGEMWIVDNKETIRTPFQYGGGYYEDSLGMILFGPRWYDSQRELFLAPDPLLVDVPRSLIDQPALGAAYTYAGASPMANVDPSGLAFFSAHKRVGVRAQWRSGFAKVLEQKFADGEGAEARKMFNKYVKQEKAQLRAESLLEANALITIDLGEGTITLAAPYGEKLKKEWNLPGSGKKDGDDATTGDATNGQGAPDLGNSSVQQGSTNPTVPSGQDSDADDAGSQDQAGPQQVTQPQTQVSATDSRSDE